MRTLAVMVLCVGCVDAVEADETFNKVGIQDLGGHAGKLDAPDPPKCNAEFGSCLNNNLADTTIRDGRRVGDPATTAGVPALSAACTATTQIAAQLASTGTCGVNVVVHVDCKGHHQNHNGIQLGVMVDGELSTFTGMLYECDHDIVHSFTVPCTASDVFGIATFDQPGSGVDTSCVSDPL